MFERMRRHPVLTFCSLLLCGVGIGLSLFLYSFDLNDYRSQLQATLQTALNRPVKIGALHFALRHGLSLDVSQAAIGGPEDSTALQVNHLVLRLRITPLLRRQLSFSRVLLDGANIQITEQKGDGSSATPQMTAPERMNELLNLLRRTKISSFVLRQGQVTLDSGGRHFALNNIDLQLNNIAFLSPIAVKASGDFSCGALQAPWQLSGKIEAAAADAPWVATDSDLTFTMKGIDLAQLSTALGQKGQNPTPGGVAELTIRANGAPANGLNFEVRAQGKDLSLALPAAYRSPLTLQDAVIAGIWQSGTPGTIHNLVLRLDNLPITGAIVLPSNPGEPYTATLTLPETPLANLGRFIPDRPLTRLATALRGNDVSGSIGIGKVQLRWSQIAGFHLDNADFHLKDGHFTLQGIGLIEKMESHGSWQEGALTLQNVQATLLGGQSTGSGNIVFPENGAPIFNLKFSSTATADRLIPILPVLWQQKLHASGPLTISAKIGGTPDRLLLDLQSGFTDAAVRFNAIPLKVPGEPGELLILGAVTSSGLELSHSLLTLPFAEARANGRIATDASGAYTLSSDIKNIIIEKLPPFLAVQKQLQGRGEVDLHLDLNGDQSGLKSLQGSGEYRKLGLHLWNAVAEVRGASGRLTLDRAGINFPAISGLLGLSPIRASGELKWHPEFKLTLDVDLEKTRSSDLVFKSPKKIFAAIRGRLVISSKGILFEKIAAEIANETTAVVQGRLTYEPARLDLEIDAVQGNIAGIIALWQNGEKLLQRTAPATTTPHHQPLSAGINVRIASGDLYGVLFKNAVGTIALRNGELFIEPLRLEIGAGSATAAISTGPLHAEHLLLKVSGVTEKINAAQVQRQLLGYRGSVTGTLNSTFSLQGEIGRFLPTSNGNINLQLTDGLLRGFTSVGRALALFNVGNILTFNFPDLDKDGLLFDKVKGRLIFTNGVVTSEDLAVASPAFDMAFVGKADLARDRLDFIIGVKPLQTVDKVLSSIPLAGWILTGEKKAFVVANFHVTGSSQDPQVEAVPFSSLSDMAVGIFKRTFGLPAKIVNDVQDLFK